MQDLQDCQRNGKCKHSMWLPRDLMEGSESWLHDGSEGSGTPLKRCATVCVCNCVSVQKKECMKACNHGHLWEESVHGPQQGLNAGLSPPLSPKRLRITA